MSFARRQAATQRFTLGHPRAVQVAPDGDRVAFLRSRSGTDPITALWVADLPGGADRVVLDPGGAGETLSAAEQARRERTREQANGVVAFAVDAAGRRAVSAVAGQLWAVELVGEPRPRVIPTDQPVLDPHLDPSGELVAYVAGGALKLAAADGNATERVLLAPEHDQISYGVAEHVAAEEMYRTRGFWWSPDGARLLVARVDETPVGRWYIGDPADPSRPPRVLRYPTAGTANAIVTLHLVDLAGGAVPVQWDREAFEYLFAVAWSGAGLVIAVQSRDQRTLRVLDVDPLTGATSVRTETHDEFWAQQVVGLPLLTAGGALVWSVDDAATDTRRLTIDGTPVTPPGLQLHDVIAVDGERFVFRASSDPVQVHVWTYSPAGLSPLTTEAGVHSAAVGGGTTALSLNSLARGPRVLVRHRDGGEHELPSLAEEPNLALRVEFLALGERELRAAVFRPSWSDGATALPVLLDPYGGPAAQMVLAARTHHHLVSQWFAELGFIVLVCDGRGTSGRGPAWERTVAFDKVDPALQDQVDALHALDRLWPGQLDLTRVGIRGWSYGGTLAAAAVLRRPDVFHAAVAGASVTDARLYDTQWQERFLGRPSERPDAYDVSSLIADAPNLRGELMLVHGLADDNVVAAHTLRLSAALTAAGRMHSVLPLPGITHMTPRLDVAENLLLLQGEFLGRALRAVRPEPAGQ